MYACMLKIVNYCLILSCLKFEREQLAYCQGRKNGNWEEPGRFADHFFPLPNSPQRPPQKEGWSLGFSTCSCIHVTSTTSLTTVGRGKRKSQASLGRSICQDPTELVRSAFLLQLLKRSSLFLWQDADLVRLLRLWDFQEKMFI